MRLAVAVLPLLVAALAAAAPSEHPAGEDGDPLPMGEHAPGGHEHEHYEHEHHEHGHDQGNEDGSNEQTHELGDGHGNEHSHLHGNEHEHEHGNEHSGEEQAHEGGAGERRRRAVQEEEDALPTDEGRLSTLVDCLAAESEDPCAPADRRLRREVSAELKSDCAGCGERDRRQARRLVHYLMEQQPKYYARLEHRYDPRHRYLAAYGSPAAKAGALSPPTGLGAYALVPGPLYRRR